MDVLKNCPCSNLETLSLDFNRLGDDGAVAVAVLPPALHKLHTLRVRFNQLGEAAVLKLVEGALESATLADLELCVSGRAVLTGKLAHVHATAHAHTSVRFCLHTAVVTHTVMPLFTHRHARTAMVFAHVLTFSRSRAHLRPISVLQVVVLLSPVVAGVCYCRGSCSTTLNGYATLHSPCLRVAARLSRCCAHPHASLLCVARLVLVA